MATTALVIMGKPPDGLDLDPTPLMENPLVIIAPPHHPLAGQQKSPLTRLQDEVFVAREQESGTPIAMERFFRQRGIKLKIRIKMTSNSAFEFLMCEAAAQFLQPGQTL